MAVASRGMLVLQGLTPILIMRIGLVGASRIVTLALTVLTLDGCAADDPTSGTSGATLGGNWVGTYSMVTNPGNDAANGTISIGFTSSSNATVRATPEDGATATLSAAVTRNGSTVTLTAVDTFAGQTHDYVFTGTVAGSMLSGGFTIEPRNQAWKSTGTFTATRQ